MSVVARSSEGDASRLVPAMRAAVARVDGALPLYDVATMETRLRDSTAVYRFLLRLLGALGISGLLLAAIGVYGVISYGVAQRTQEIGIRVALGAARTNVLRLVVGHAATLTLGGLGLGLLGAAALARLLGGLLFQVSPTDPPSFGIGIAVLGLVSITAALVPALRAARVDPADALRAE
jgi:ABC-type antimicrobial peptide transport system permease subunit